MAGLVELLGIAITLADELIDFPFAELYGAVAEAMGDEGVAGVI